MHTKNKPTSILNIILLALTLARLFLAVKLPLCIQGDAAFDDLLMARYAQSLIGGEWLGTFDGLTLTKTISYPIFLAVNFVLGIPYVYALTLFYIFAVFCLVTAFRKLITNRYALAVLYLFLLYSPVMLHQENVQKVYRGGCLVCASMAVFAAFIGMFANREEGPRKIFPWTILGTVMLPFFYYLKEDGIWIVPFCAGAALATALWLIITRKTDCLIKKTIMLAAPLLALLVVSLGYKAVNYVHYGAFVTTDRAEGTFSELMGDLVRIDAGENADEIWVSRKAFDMAMDASPTFAAFRDDVNEMYDSDNWYVWDDGEIHGDYYIWALRDMFSSGGLYADDAKASEYLYGRIHAELTAAFDKGALPKRKAVYLSKVAQGIDADNVKYLSDTFAPCMKSLATYSENRLSIEYASGDGNAIQIMSEITQMPAIWPGTQTTAERELQSKFVALANVIVTAYQKLGLPLLFAGLAGLIVLLVTAVMGLANADGRAFSVWLICFGLFASFAALFAGVQWFTRFLGAGKKFYDYMCCGVPVLQILEFVGIWSIVSVAAAKIRTGK